MHLKRHANSNDQRRPTLSCSLSRMSDRIGFAGVFFLGGGGSLRT